ncbi:FAD FMN-containing dehydrogenase [Raphidocelis subcapitata]|uniref:FAD FMN-containing dehydrogenase n=1 Tax=Raphidocelis subcapitata TaxID=307507 RepID=A0A2V0P7P5_9CHLO|nr:FAD FMN-containing dehydrogenase [Raphidocelis subcapitata]|eukprot:GBF95589.1 FAD FMN-containing dehydrogenase [Raphidocelis subcapitata]
MGAAVGDQRARRRAAVAAATALLAAWWCCCAAAQVVKPTPRQAYGAAYGHMACQASVLIEPNSTEQLAAALKSHLAAAAAAGKSVKVRATHKFFHSTTAFACPSNTTNIFTPEAGSRPAFGAGPDLSVGVLLGGMDRVLSTDPAIHTMRVQAGMTVRQLLEAATAAGMSVPLGTVPAFADLMLGGVLLTGAHGSNYKGKSNLGDILKEITWVDATGTTRTSARDSPEGRALAGGLGLLGIVSELTLQLAPPSNTRFETVWQSGDEDIASDILELVARSPRALVVWRPDMHKYTAVLLSEVPASEPTTGATQTIELPKLVASGFGTMVRTWEEMARPPYVLEEAMCIASKEVSISHGWASNLRGRPLKNGVGPTNEMQSVSCGDQCAWEAEIANLAMWDTHFTTELWKLPDWIADVKKLMAEDFTGRCLPPGYFWLRFGDGNGDLLSPASGLNGTVNLQLSFMTSKASAPQWGIKHGHILETLEQLTLCKYKGRPHWGKNHERTYTHPNCSVPELYPRFGEFLAMRSKLDPARVFEPPLFAQMLARAPPRYGPRCALSGECFCREDKHCGPGRACVPSAAFPEYRACRRVGATG